MTALATGGFRHVSITVGDLAAAEAFYGGLLGLPRLPRPDLGVPGIWYDLGAGLQLHVLVNEALVRPEAERRSFTLCYPHFALACEDVAATTAALRERGLETFENRPPGAGFAQVFVKDPSGNMIEFIGRAP